MPVCVVLCLCMSSPCTVNREIKDERVLWSSPPLAAQSGVLAKFPLWCRCGACLSFFHRDSGEVGVLSLAAGRRPAICHAKPGTSTRAPEGSGESKVSCPFSSSEIPLSLSCGISRSYQVPSRRPAGTSLTSCFWRWWGGRRWTGGAVRRLHTHLLWECPGGVRSRQPGEDHCHVANFHHLWEGETFPSTTAHAIFASKLLTQQKHVLYVWVSHHHGLCLCFPLLVGCQDC